MQPLIVLGASARAAGHSALRGGFAPYAIDLFADRDLAAVCPAIKIQRYPTQFLQALAAAPDAPWMYTGSLENYPRLVDRLANARPLWGNAGNVLEQARSPKRLASLARQAGCDFPRLSAAARTVLKPRRGSGGLAIRFASAAEIVRPPRGFYLQEYIAGEAASAVYVAAGGKAVLLGATRQLLGRDFDLPRPFLYVGSIGPLALRAQETENLRRLGAVLAKELELRGLFNVDFMRTADSLWIVEINPRFSASIEVLERAADTSFVTLHAAACQRNQLPAEGFRVSKKYCGKAVVYAQRDAVVPIALDEVARAWNQRENSPGLADIPSLGEALAAGQPVATVLVDGNSPAAVDHALRSRVAELQQLLTC